MTNIHRVAKGESLYKIAEKYGMTFEQLLQLNKQFDASASDGAVEDSAAERAKADKKKPHRDPDFLMQGEVIKVESKHAVPEATDPTPLTTKSITGPTNAPELDKNPALKALRQLADKSKDGFVDANEARRFMSKAESHLKSHPETSDHKPGLTQKEAKTVVDAFSPKPAAKVSPPRNFTVPAPNVQPSASSAPASSAAAAPEKPLSAGEVMKALAEPESYFLGVGGKLGLSLPGLATSETAKKFHLDKLDPAIKVFVALTYSADDLQKKDYTKPTLFLKFDVPGVSKPVVMTLNPATGKYEAGTDMFTTFSMKDAIGKVSPAAQNSKLGEYADYLKIWGIKRLGVDVKKDNINASANAGFMLLIPGSETAFNMLGNYVGKGARAVEAAELAAGGMAALPTGGVAALAGIGAAGMTELARMILTDSIKSGRLYLGCGYRADLSLNAQNDVVLKIPGRGSGSVDLNQMATILSSKFDKARSSFGIK